MAEIGDDSEPAESLGSRLGGSGDLSRSEGIESRLPREDTSHSQVNFARALWVVLSDRVSDPIDPSSSVKYVPRQRRRPIV